METKNYTISETSKHLLDVLDTYCLFSNKLLDVLTEMYGQTEAQRLYSSHEKELDAVSGIVMDYLKILFTVQMGTDETDIEL